MTGIEILGGSRQSDKLTGDDDQLNLIFGLDGNDSLFGGPGLDLVAGGPGNDRLEGQRGFDVVDYAFAATAVNVNLNTSSAVGDGSDTLNGIEVVSGTPYDDIITGDGDANFLWGAAGNDQIFGLSGDDDLQGDAGDDMLDGGEGVFDFADYFFTATAVNASLATQSASGDGNDQFANIEGLIGSSFNDTLTGARETTYSAGRGATTRSPQVTDSTSSFSSRPRWE
jgi:Ca2+-binding RTX toxin-like protein